MTGSYFADTILKHKYLMKERNEKTWEDIAVRVTDAVARPLLDEETTSDIYTAIAAKKLVPGGRYLYASGRKIHQVNNCFLFSVEDTKESWADLTRRAVMALTTGGGIGVDYSKIRPKGSYIAGMGGVASGPLSLIHMVNEIGRNIQQGGSRRSAIWAGLNWQHDDIFEFIHAKDWSTEIRAMKERDFNAIAPLDGTNISVLLDDTFFDAYYNPTHTLHTKAVDVYNLTTKRMLKTSEPGFSVDVGVNSGETLRNACCEVTSADDNDVCNLASINLTNIENLDDMAKTVRLATIFTMCGSIYSDVPFAEVAETRDRNRRIGVGLMGLHFFLLKSGYTYEPHKFLGDYLDLYAEVTDTTAKEWSTRLGINEPIKKRAVAPTGTISIVAGAGTSGIEPVFSTAFKRRYLKGNVWHYQYVVDETARKLVTEYNVNPEEIETAYTIPVERRLAMQAYVQRYVDQGISSTINLPAWGSENNNELTVGNFRDTLLKYLPHLRGVTTYPDGARGGQPLTPVPYYEAIKEEGVEFLEYGNENACVSGVCGT